MLDVFGNIFSWLNNAKRKEQGDQYSLVSTANGCCITGITVQCILDY